MKLFVLVLIFLLLIILINTVNCIVTSTKSLPTIIQTGVSKRLVYVIPFIDNDAHQVLETIKNWSKYNPCQYSTETMNNNKRNNNNVNNNIISPIDLVLYYNKKWKESAIRHDFEVNITNALQYSNSMHCFNEIKYISASLTIYEDIYPAGPSYMFYKIFLKHIEHFSGIYDYMFWAEHDVHPIRNGWLDILIQEITFNHDFYWKGSIHRGILLDRTVTKYHKSNSNAWIGHINGNGLYKLNDVLFNELIRETSIIYPPSVGMKNSMDIALWKNVVTNYMSNWKQYQEYAHKIIYTDLIQSHGRAFSIEELKQFRLKYPNTWYIHGSAQSAGNTAAQLMRKQHKSRKKLD